MEYFVITLGDIDSRSLMWKYGGLFVQNDTLLLLSLKSYYNFVVLNSAGKLQK